MDIVSLLSTSVPAYFVLGPTFVLFVLLITLIAKSGKPQAIPLVAQAVVPTVVPLPVGIAQVSSQAAALEVRLNQPPVEVPVAPSMSTPTLIATEPAVIPPVSSWKPSAAPVVVVEEVVATPVAQPVEQAPVQAEVAPVTPVIVGDTTSVPVPPAPVDATPVATDTKPTF